LTLREVVVVVQIVRFDLDRSLLSSSSFLAFFDVGVESRGPTFRPHVPQEVADVLRRERLFVVSGVGEENHPDVATASTDPDDGGRLALVPRVLKHLR